MTKKQKDPFGGEVDVELETYLDAYRSGNPAGLLKALKYSQQTGDPLPAKAMQDIEDIICAYFSNLTHADQNSQKQAKEQGDVHDSGQKGRHARYITKFRAALTQHIRIQAYRGIRRWQMNPWKYDYLPQSTLQKWYDGKIKHGDKTKNWAYEQTSKALSKTPYAATAINLEKHIIPKAKLPKEFKPSEAADSMAAVSGPNDQPPLDFSWHGWEEEEKIFGLALVDLFPRPAGPPKHILEYLEKHPPKSPDFLSDDF